MPQSAVRILEIKYIYSNIILWGRSGKRIALHGVARNISEIAVHSVRLCVHRRETVWKERLADGEQVCSSTAKELTNVNENGFSSVRMCSGNGQIQTSAGVGYMYILYDSICLRVRTCVGILFEFASYGTSRSYRVFFSTLRHDRMRNENRHRTYFVYNKCVLYRAKAVYYVGLVHTYMRVSVFFFNRSKRLKRSKHSK